VAPANLWGINWNLPVGERSQGNALGCQGLLAILNFSDPLDLIPGYEISETYILQKSVNLFTQIFPKVMGQTGFSALTVTCPLALGRIYRLINCIDYLSDENSFGISLQLVSTSRPPHAAHQRILSQLCKQLLKIGKRNFLALRNIGEADWPAI
jgi:hypothetical protein